MAKRPAVLEVEYDSATAFCEDFHANLSNGGVFVGTDGTFEPRQTVVVRLCLQWCEEEIDLEGEIVHLVPPEMAGASGSPGVAVQFLAGPAEVRDRVGVHAEEKAPKPKAVDGETRVSPRRMVRLPASIHFGSKEVEGRTRNLSHTGVLIGLESGTVKKGEEVSVALRHERSGEVLEVAGRVVRELRGETRVEAVAIHFDETADASSIAHFLEIVQSSEHARRLGGISGPIAELGPASIVQMLATTAQRGTILLRSGEEEGVICFEGGLLRKLRLGSVGGMKALVRMLSWREGTFEFHTTLEEIGGEPPLPFEAAMLDAVRQIDEGNRIDATVFPLQARLVGTASKEGDFTGSLSKVEEALLDLATAGFTVQRSLEVIPEPDPDIFRALQNLIDGGMLELH